MTDHLQHCGGSSWAGRLAGLMLLGGALVCANPAFANTLDLTYAAFRLDGHTASPLQQGELVRFGQEMVIKIKYVNQTMTSAPAGAIVLTLPSGCAFVRSDDANHLEVSVDGGRQFGPPRRIQGRQGQGVRAIKSNDATYIRMTFDHPIPPGEGGEINIVAAQE